MEFFGKEISIEKLFLISLLLLPVSIYFLSTKNMDFAMQMGEMLIIFAFFNMAALTDKFYFLYYVVFIFNVVFLFINAMFYFFIL